MAFRSLLVLTPWDIAYALIYADHHKTQARVNHRLENVVPVGEHLPDQVVRLQQGFVRDSVGTENGQAPWRIGDGSFPG